jgi:four helix bundle protein
VSPTNEIKSYKDLLIWQKGIELCKLIYTIVPTFPDDEKFGLCLQMKRAVISIPSNIAEGYGRNYSKSYIHFLSIARGSLAELETQLIIAKELKFIDNISFEQTSEMIVGESKMLNSFIKSVKNKSNA